MKRFIITLMTIIICLSMLAGCQKDTVDSVDDFSTEKLSVVATVFPPYDFVREIAGNNVELTMLLSPGSESHSYDPTPQDIIMIQNCDIFIYVGGESDEWVDKILNSMDTGNMKIIPLMDLVDTVEEEVVEGMEEEEEHEEEISEGEALPELDEHVWTSPENAITIVKYITNALCELDSSNASAYESNAAVYLEKLSELDESFQQVVDKALRNTVIFADRFPFRYFADAYNLDYYAAFPGCSTETEASAATVAFLIEKVNEENIPVVFHIEFSNEKMADAICESTGAGKMLLHSCHNITKDDFESGVSYLELMNQNVENLKEALQ